MRQLIPNKTQWQTWSLPSRLTALGTLFGALGLLVTVILFLASGPARMQEPSQEPKTDARLAPQLQGSGGQSQEEQSPIQDLTEGIAGPEIQENDIEVAEENSRQLGTVSQRPPSIGPMEDACSYTRHSKGFNSKEILQDARLLSATKLTKQLRKGADIEAEDRDNGDATPLIIATYYKSANVIRRLLSCGANVNAATNSGYTPLAIASASDSRKTLERLLEYGADLGPVTESGPTPLKMAIKCGKDANVRLLAGSSQFKQSPAIREAAIAYAEDQIEKAKAHIKKMEENRARAKALEDQKSPAEKYLDQILADTLPGPTNISHSRPREQEKSWEETLPALCSSRLMDPGYLKSLEEVLIALTAKP